jgi:Zn-dependent oligopeptidase
MKLFSPLLPLLVTGLTCELSGAQPTAIESFQAAAARTNRVLDVPEFERTAGALMESITIAIAKGNSALDQIGSQNLDHVSFESTVAALENLRAESSLVANRAALISGTNPDSLMRGAAESARKKLEEWNVGLDYREDVFKAIKAFRLEKTKTERRRRQASRRHPARFSPGGNGIGAPEREKIKQLRSNLSRLAAEFESNLLAANAPAKRSWTACRKTSFRRPESG